MRRPRLYACAVASVALSFAIVGHTASKGADTDTTSAQLHAVTGAYAAALAASAPTLRACAPSDLVFPWLRANASLLDTLHDPLAAGRLWRIAAEVAAQRRPQWRLEALNASARLGLEAGQFEGAGGDASAARVLAHAFGDERAEAEATYWLSNSLRLRGDVNAALKVATESAALAQHADDVGGSARALTEMATIAKNKGDYIQGLEYEIQALRQEPPGTDVQARAVTLSKLGKLYEQIEDNTQALEYAERSLTLAEGHANRETLAHILVSYANMLNDLSPEQHERALTYAKRALGFALETGHRPLEIDAALQVARAQFNDGALDAAAESFEHALRVARAIGQKASIAHVLLRRSELIERGGHLDEAIADTRSAIELYRGSDNVPRLIKADAILERQLDAVGDHAGAQAARLQRFELRDRVLGASAMRNLAQIEASRLQETQQQQIELLKRQAEIDALRLERGTLLRWLALLVAGSLGLALLLMIRRLGRSQRVNRLLQGKNLEILAQQEALEAVNAELQRSAISLFAAVSTDALTGALSRTHGLKLLADGIAAATAGARQYSTLLLDVDHFKLVNDRYGHLQGDRVLAGIAANLRDGLRDGDALVRFGGEEFLILLPDTELSAATALAQHLWRRIEALPRSALPPTHVTVSIGVCALAQLERHSVEALIEGADRALYLAKNSGRNRVVVFGAPPASAQAPSAG